MDESTLPDAQPSDTPSTSSPQDDLSSAAGFQIQYPPFGADTGLDLFPDWLMAQQPTGDLCYDQRGSQIVFAKLFTPDADWTLFVDKCDMHHQEVYGYAILNGDLQNAEWGWQDVAALKAVRGRLGLPMERDITFQAQSILSAVAAYRHERGWDDPTDAVLRDPVDPQPVPPDLPPADPPSSALAVEILQAAPPTPVQDSSLVPASSVIPSGLTQLPQAYIGRVNVVGDCYCYGLVLDHRPPNNKGIPIYVSVAGPATSVEALWARLSQGKETTVVPDDKNAAAIYLEPNKGGLYVRYQKKIEALGIDHLILMHENLAEPTYSAEDDVTPMTYVLCLSADHARAKLGEHVRKLVKVTVFDSWFDYLHAEGFQTGLIRSCTGHGIDALCITLHAAKWTALITTGLTTRRITLP